MKSFNFRESPICDFKDVTESDIFGSLEDDTQLQSRWKDTDILTSKWGSDGAAGNFAYLVIIMIYFSCTLQVCKEIRL